MVKQRDWRDQFVGADFFRTHWVWLMVAVGVLLAVTIGVAVTWPYFHTPDPQVAEARQACQDDIRGQLADEGPIVFEDETVEESGENSWHVNGTVILSGMGTQPREYECEYTEGERADVELRTR